MDFTALIGFGFVFVLGLALGGAAVFFILRSKIDLEKARASVFEAQLKSQAEQKEELRESFSLAANEILDRNAKKLEESALKDLQNVKNETQAELEKRKISIELMAQEIKTKLTETATKIQTFETERTTQYSKLEKHLFDLTTQSTRLAQQTDNLKSALTTSSSVRGRWGELVLKNILRESELVEGIDFEEQFVTSSEEGDTLKPDFVIRLPKSDQKLVIDAKTSLYESFLESEKVQDETERTRLHKEFVVKMRKRIKELTSKEYQKYVSASAPYVVMFVPSESGIRAAFDADPTLFRDAMEQKVFIASPATIIPLILLVAQSWKEHRFSEGARELYQAVDKLGQRLQKFVERMGGIERGLTQASKAWNELIDQSWNGRQGVVKSLEETRTLGGNLPELGQLQSVTQELRALEPPTLHG